MGNIPGPLSSDGIPYAMLNAPYEGYVPVYELSPDLQGEDCDQADCKIAREGLEKAFFEGRKRKIPDILETNQSMWFRRECAGRCGKVCVMQLVQYNRLGEEIVRVEKPGG